MKYRLTEHHDILPGVRKRKGTVVINLDPERVKKGVSEGWLEPVDYRGLPEDYPCRKVLVAHGYYSIPQVEAARDEHLLDIDGIGKKYLAQIREYEQ